VKRLGLLEYAWSIFFEKDWLKTKLLLSNKHKFSQFFCDKEGFVCVFPEPTLTESDENETIAMMGYQFPTDTMGRVQFATLFRAAVFHLDAHVLSSDFEDYESWRKGKDNRLTKFVSSIVEDAKATAYISTKHPDKLHDLAFANALALKRLRQINRFINPTTRIMAGLLIKTHTGLMLIKSENEQKTIAQLAGLLDQFKEKALASFSDEKIALKDEKLKVADAIYSAIENIGTITETPFLPHTEELGTCSIFSPSYLVNTDVSLEPEFAKCLEFLSKGTMSPRDATQTSGKIAEAEAIQIFDSWKHQKEKDQKIITRYETLLPLTRFKSVEIPEYDYTEFLRVKARTKSETHRLMESLLVARDAVDEDPRKNYGVLDLQDMIQVVASKSPRMDVFMLDENISKSYSWVILLDASRSMKYIKDFALEIAAILAEIANELLLDPTSWGMYAYNDRLLVIKDLRERYNVRVKSRIGGIKFEGFTYMPDALTIAGQILKERAENLRLIAIISDGWPYGYSEVNAALSEILNTLTGGNISVIGIGARTRRMEFFFKSNCTAYTLRDLSKKFSNLYFEVSNIASGT